VAAPAFPTSELIAAGAVVMALAKNVVDWIKSWGSAQSEKDMDHRDVEALKASVKTIGESFASHEKLCAEFRGSVKSDLETNKESSRLTETAVASLTSRPFST
jgi:hypothetical protein